MNRFINKRNYYHIIDGEDNILSSTFCGRVPQTVVNEPVFMNPHKVNTLMAFNSNVKRKGYGKELLQKVIKAEKESGTRYLTLGVSKNNQVAIRLYENFGFIIQGDCAGRKEMHFMYLDLSYEKLSIEDDNFWSWKVEEGGYPYNIEKLKVLKNGVLHYHKLLRNDLLDVYCNYTVTPMLIKRFLRIYGAKLKNPKK